MKYLKIFAAIEMIAHDAGMTSRHSPRNLCKEVYDGIIGSDGVKRSELDLIESWFLGLLEEEFSTVCCGEHDEMKELSKKFPHKLGPDGVGIYEFLDGIHDDLVEDRS